MQLQSRSVQNVQILSLEGRFDTYTASVAREWIEAASADEPANIVINLSEVTFVDSTALSTLVRGMKRTRSRNGNLHLCGLQQSVRMVFELTRLDKVFDIFVIEEDAVRAFSV